MLNLPSFFYKVENEEEDAVSGFVFSEAEKHELIEGLEDEIGYTFILK